MAMDHPLPEPFPVEPEDRPAKPAMWRGFRQRCPNCGDGPIFDGYLKVVDHCAVCREDLTHQRADDGPAYLTILIVGHILAPAMLWLFVAYRPDPWILATVFTIGCTALTLYLLPRLKGAMIGLQWSRRMHGFGGDT